MSYQFEELGNRKHSVQDVINELEERAKDITGATIEFFQPPLYQDTELREASNYVCSTNPAPAISNQWKQ